MASDASPVQTSATHLVQGSSAPSVAQVQQNTSGKSLPPSGRTATLASASSAQNTNDGAANAANSGSPLQSGAKSGSSSAPASANQTVAAAAPTRPTPVESLVTQLNKTLNDSGRPDQYRVDPQSASMIQEVNPANGAVIGQFSADEFPALARSVGATGLLIDSLA